MIGILKQKSFRFRASDASSSNVRKQSEHYGNDDDGTHKLLTLTIPKKLGAGPRVNPLIAYAVLPA